MIPDKENLFQQFEDGDEDTFISLNHIEFFWMSLVVTGAINF